MQFIFALLTSKSTKEIRTNVRQEEEFERGFQKVHVDCRLYSEKIDLAKKKSN